MSILRTSEIHEIAYEFFEIQIVWMSLFHHFYFSTSVYEVVSRLACDYDFDPTRISVSHKGNELPPSAVLLADISHDSTLRLSFRKQRRHPMVPGGSHNHTSGNMTLPNTPSVKVNSTHLCYWFGWSLNHFAFIEY